MENVDRVFYPHGIYLTGGTEITQLIDPSPSHNFKHATEYAASQAGPQFTGTHEGMPDFKFRTPALKTALSLTAAARFWMTSGVLSGSNLIEYMASVNAGIRDNGGGADITATCEKVGLFIEQISARHGAIAEATCRLACLFDNESGNDPMVFSTAQNVSAVPVAAEQYTLGKVLINTVDAGCVEELTLDNGIEYEEVACGGLPFLSYIGVKKCAPVVRIVTNKLSFINTLGTRGTAITNVTWYFQKKLISGINVPAATAAHAKFVATAGTVKATAIQGSKGLCMIEAHLRQSAANTAPYTYTADQAM